MLKKSQSVVEEEKRHEHLHGHAAEQKKSEKNGHAASAMKDLYDDVPAAHAVGPKKAVTMQLGGAGAGGRGSSDEEGDLQRKGKQDDDEHYGYMPASHNSSLQKR